MENPYLEYFQNRAGEGKGDFYPNIGRIYKADPRYQKGFGNRAFFQRKQGNGIGSILKSLWRIASPMIKTGAKSLGKTAINVASNIAQDVIEGKDIKDSAKKHISGVINKIPAPSIQPVSQKPELVAPTPPPLPKFKRRPPKRKINKKSNIKTKYPALNLLQ